jgi:hypothetical protein
MGKGSNLVYNIISLLALLGTLLVIIGVAVIVLLTPPPPPSPLELTQLAEAIIPTRTPTDTPTATSTPTVTRTPLPPTFTLTPTETFTPEPTATFTPSITPSATITDTPAPTFTPSITPTPAATNTPEPTATPTGPTPTFTPSVSPYLFALRDQVQFVRNFANSAGCAWQGIGGQVINLNGTPFVGNLVVHVYNNNFDRKVPVGSNSFYGTAGPNGETSGWEVQVGNAVDSQLYFVQLESQAGTQVSDTVQVRFAANCDGNAAIVTFLQTRPLQ